MQAFCPALSTSSPDCIVRVTRERGAAVFSSKIASTLARAKDVPTSSDVHSDQSSPETVDSPKEEAACPEPPLCSLAASAMAVSDTHSSCHESANDIGLVLQNDVDVDAVRQVVSSLTQDQKHELMYYKPPPSTFPSTLWHGCSRKLYIPCLASEVPLAAL